MNKIISISAVTALAAGMAFATIQPTRVGPVSTYGALQAGKTSAGFGRIYGSVNGVADGKEVQLKGMSLGWSLYWPNNSSFYGHSYIDSLVGARNPELIRSAMGVVATWGHGNYKTRPDYYSAQMDSVVQAAIENDIYVLIDFHSEGGYYYNLHPNGTPKYKFNDSQVSFSAADAAEFFGVMAKRYGKYPHVIFEIYNEPVSETWDELKAYADTVITEIRKYSTNLVVVGTPMWSSSTGDPVDNPVLDDNVAYTYHYYGNQHSVNADAHGGTNLSLNHAAGVRKSIAAGLSVFITEWGFTDSLTGTGTKERTDDFLAFADSNKLSMAKWNVDHPYSNGSVTDNYEDTYYLRAKNSLTYTKNLNWETTISDALPIAPIVTKSSAVEGVWSFTMDKDKTDSKGNTGSSTDETSSSADGAEMTSIILDQGASEYAPYVRAVYTYSSDISKCRMISYKYKGANHQFILAYDWNTTESVWGEGAWDFPYVEMPYSPEWTTAYIDWRWLKNSGWQTTLPTDSVDFSVATALEFNVERVAYDPSLYLKDLTCAEEGENLPAGIRKASNILSIVQLNVYRKTISASGLKVGERYVLTNMKGETIASGIVKNSSQSLVVANGGRYMLKVGNTVYPLSIR